MQSILAAGEHVGYSCTWIADRPSLIATVQGGYADGFLRTLSNTAILWAGEEPCPVVGRISMDMITVSLEHLPDAAVGSEVTLWGTGPADSLLPIDEVAAHCGTIGYELMCALAQRVPVVVAD